MFLCERRSDPPGLELGRLDIGTSLLKGHTLSRHYHSLERKETEPTSAHRLTGMEDKSVLKRPTKKMSVKYIKNANVAFNRLMYFTLVGDYQSYYSVQSKC